MSRLAVKRQEYGFYLILVFLIPILVFVGFRIDAYWNRLSTGSPVEVKNEIGKPYAILTIDYGGPVEGFEKGEFYVLKVLKVRGTKVDYGFCPIKRKDFYNKDE